jgi:hypothetical protein
LFILIPLKEKTEIMWVIHGVSEILLNYHEDEYSECTNCNHSETTYRVVQKYYHVYGLPFFPVEKYTGLYCNNCNYHAKPVVNDKSILYEKLSRTPLYLYIGSVVLTIIIAFFIFVLIF